MITVHHLNNSRSQRILWMLEELGVPYEIQHYKRDPKSMLAPDSLKKIHPLGKSPVITDGDLVIAESGAIIEYLARTYGKDTMLPKSGGQAWLDYTYWLHYAEGSLMPPLLMRLVFEKVKTSPMPFFVKPVARGIANKTNEVFIGPMIKMHLDFVESHLAKNTWFLGDNLSAADIQMSFPLEASVARGITGKNRPSITAWVKSVHARPAYRIALEKGGEYDFA
ncbi:glutathione S-transferase family protein [Marinobacter psychrophilus]|jgi:glutathione S-transferase|uniref:glutathione S-transferase family protein n=1 Tax=Marinobacter psychrophilus TaxID=330734 RepID=UPI001B5EC5B8|nr:glutathione S-transferase [Marinobacter psychrophilus]MBQ0762293.1 glutathione S-transferase [Marinobacter psychrophilus]MBQ0843861.1 glutathione S-transferase [Marinobacter psychrophilus]